MITKGQIKQSLDYWMGITDCNCNSTLPTGGCLKCDLEEIRDYIFGENETNDVKCKDCAYWGKYHPADPDWSHCTQMFEGVRVTGTYETHKDRCCGYGITNEDMEIRTREMNGYTGRI